LHEGRISAPNGLFEREGLTATRDDIEAVAAHAWQAATDDTFAP
jgi:hypothetical protein